MAFKQPFPVELCIHGINESGAYTSCLGQASEGRHVGRALFWRCRHLEGQSDESSSGNGHGAGLEAESTSGRDHRDAGGDRGHDTGRVDSGGVAGGLGGGRDDTRRGRDGGDGSAGGGAGDGAATQRAVGEGGMALGDGDDLLGGRGDELSRGRVLRDGEGGKESDGSSEAHCDGLVVSSCWKATGNKFASAAI
ncbi:hypothetical protein CCM_07260 [Cordyceps militaris CM01]|uniref:Uncharacterized protein n=1 Tax=Cordyceps militaris (strain CM01) TaxID=983644 RepID=G3JMG1_CORMM|nr:uncharacterized protein CCM_07260 [Cordyceps militaris CM01]EGX90840.1 hypothetical protein CCM_07260 [Cordyceps militaris CM01]